MCQPRSGSREIARRLSAYCRDVADRWSLIALVLLASAGALDGYAWYLTCSAHPATGPHRMVWHRGDGSLAPTDPHDVDPYAKCEGEDIALTFAVWERGLFVRCDEETSVGVGWALLDPATGQAALRWPAPSHNGYTHALVPGPEHQLAIIYGGIDDNDLSVGIATHDVGARPPESLGRVHYDAAAWVGTNLEIVVTKLGAAADSSDMYFTRPHSVITIGKGATTTREVPALCPEPDCAEPQLVYRAAGRWVFEDWGHATTESGEHVPGRFSGPGFAETVDRAEQGTLTATTSGALAQSTPVLHADGTAGASPPLPAGVLPDRLVDEARFEIDEHGIRRRPRWFIGAGYGVMMENIAGRSLFWSHDRSELTRVADSAAQLAAARPVVRSSPSLEQRGFIPDGHDGYWLVDVSGEYVHLDHALARIDPLTLREHLRQRGSVGPFIDEPEHERKLAWALFGLPVLLLVGACFGLSRRDAKLRWSPPWSRLALVAAVYLVTGGLALS